MYVIITPICIYAQGQHCAFDVVLLVQDGVKSIFKTPLNALFFECVNSHVKKIKIELSVLEMSKLFTSINYNYYFYYIRYLHKVESFFEKLVVAQLVRSHETRVHKTPATGFYPEPHKSNPHSTL